MIEIKELKKSFGKQIVLNGINFSSKNETVGLLGANGSGKTTFFKCILGLLDYEGEILIDGLELRKHSLEIKEKIGYVPQTFPLWGDFNIDEILRFFSKLRGVSLKKQTELLEQFQLSAHTNKSIKELSGGMRQKLSIAIALMSDPEILLLDEPTANLDAWAIHDILTIFRTWHGQKTLLLSSHRLEEVQSVAGRMVQLENGKFVQPDISRLRLDPLREES